MTRISRRLLTTWILLLALVVHAAPAAAATTKFIGATGTSSASGTCSITIESFDLAVRSGPGISSAQIVTVVPIPAASTATNTAILIRNAVDADLPADYVVTIPGGAPNRVQIFRTGGTFTMSVVEDVPTQVIEEYIGAVPFLSGPAYALLGMILLGAGVWFGFSRRRSLAHR